MVKYQYQLEGYDKNWSPVTSRSNASFGNIQEGTYTFKLRAKGANGVWTKPVIHRFRVLPPWWRSWWAYGIYISLLMLTVWRVHLFQKAVTIRKEREKIKDRELAHRDKIFQPFFTTKPTGQGTGLVLSLAYDIVTKGHGGTLEAECEEEVGTAFIARLPFKTSLYS